MKKIKLFASLILTISILTISCTKDEESISTAKKNLTGSWLKTNVEKRVGEGSWADITKDCELDDIEEYASNGNWTFFLGTNRCFSSVTSIYTGTWQLRTNDTKIIFTYVDAVGNYEKSIETLTDKLLIITHNSNDLNNSQFRYTFSKVK
jgi:hypothetical protein